MDSLPRTDQSEEKIIAGSADSIKKLYSQIRKMPELSSQARAIDQVLTSRLQDLKGNVSLVIAQFADRKKSILQRLDGWIVPIAKEVLDGWLSEAQKLKYKLDDKLSHLEEIAAEEWDAEATNWAQLYSKWNDESGLINKILQAVADKTHHLIDKDIQVIKEYQSQSLANLPEESETFKNIEERLVHAIDEPLKQLMSLRQQAKEHTSLQQASEWGVKLQEKREVYFDQLLMRIDHVMKDVVKFEEAKDWTVVRDVEDEVIFMEREIFHIQQDLVQLHLMEEAGKQFLQGRLEGLLDHTEELGQSALPDKLRKRLNDLNSIIGESLLLF